MSAAFQPLSSQFRTAFLTGASAGLGQAFARMLRAEGVEVWGSARSESRLSAFADDPGFHPVVLDLHEVETTELGFARAREEAGGFDLLINNAGYGAFGAFAEEDFATWEAQLAAMLVQPMRLAHLALRDFRSRGRGTLVNVASLAVEFPLPYMSGYNVVKAGLAALSESLLIETAGTPITVVDFRPGDYRTGFNLAMSQVTAPTATSVRPPRLQQAWAVLEANLAAAPEATRAAEDLKRALRGGVCGVVRSGSVFQATLAPTFSGFLPERLRRAVRWRYFGLR